MEVFKVDPDTIMFVLASIIMVGCSLIVGIGLCMGGMLLIPIEFLEKKWVWIPGVSLVVCFVIVISIILIYNLPR